MSFRQTEHPLTATPGFGWGAAAFQPLSPKCPVPFTTSIKKKKKCPVSEWEVSSRQVGANVNLRIFTCSPSTTAQYALLVWCWSSPSKPREVRKREKCREKHSGLWPKGDLSLSFVVWGLYHEEAGRVGLYGAHQQALEAMGTVCPSSSYSQALKPHHAHQGGFHSSGISHVSKTSPINVSAWFLHSWA